MPYPTDRWDGSSAADDRIEARRDQAIPSFAALIALEAFVRFGSMKRAAQELGMATSNVSRHVHKLADATQLTLVQGRRPLISPSAKARELAAAVRDAIALIEKALGEIANGGTEENASARQSTLPSLAQCRTLETFVRLGSLRAAAIELDTSPSNVGHSIRKLQVSLDARLTVGERTRTRATPDGLRLAAAIAAALDCLQSVLDAR